MVWQQWDEYSFSITSLGNRNKRLEAMSVKKLLKFSAISSGVFKTRRAYS